MPALTADLTVVRLASVLQLLESEQLTARVEIAPTGWIAMTRGQVTAAAWNRLTGVDAVLTLLTLPHGACEVRPVDAPPAPAIADLMALMIDGARRYDDWAQLAPRVLAPQGSLPADLPDRVRGVLAAMDGSRIVDEAVRAASAEVVEVLDDLLDLLTRGMLVEAGPPRPDRLVRMEPGPTEAPPQASDFYALVDASRAAVRSKDYAEAGRLLTEAAAQRPDDRTIAQNLRRIQQFLER